MKYPPNPLINAYFNNIISYGQSEIYTTKKVVNGFDIKDSFKMYRFGQYVNYKSDSVGELTQNMQTLDFTLYVGTGDCEDYTRAYVKILKELKLPVYYWLMFTDTNYLTGHAIPLYINENGNLSALNYTNYYVVDSIQLEKKDIEENTTKFQEAFSVLHGAIINNFEDYSINWIIKTDENEKPLGYTEMRYIPMFRDVWTKSYIQDRSMVLKYIERINLSRNIVISDFIIPIFAFIVVYMLSRWLE